MVSEIMKVLALCQLLSHSLKMGLRIVAVFRRHCDLPRMTETKESSTSGCREMVVTG